MTTTTKTEAGKCAQLHQLWAEVLDGELPPRAFAVDLGVAHGFNPSTCRTQYQVAFKRAQLVEPVADETQH
ncbi:MAG: hypothetical protein HYX43_14555 [Burkholderiales bacterium]|jgi:hypothetical protein|nr:hypothetical protein [Burkholderiales bacterium]